MMFNEYSINLVRFTTKYCFETFAKKEKNIFKNMKTILKFYLEDGNKKFFHHFLHALIFDWIFPFSSLLFCYNMI